MFRKGRHFLPAFFCLLMKKSKQVYLPTFRTIYKELAPHFCGESVHQDFESATEKNIRQVLTECSTENQVMLQYQNKVLNTSIGNILKYHYQYGFSKYTCPVSVFYRNT